MPTKPTPAKKSSAAKKVPARKPAPAKKAPARKAAPVASTAPVPAVEPAAAHPAPLSPPQPDPGWVPALTAAVIAPKQYVRDQAHSQLNFVAGWC